MLISCYLLGVSIMAANRVWGEGNEVSRRLGFAPACFIYVDDFTKRMTGIEICEACEEVAGLSSMEGCQKLGGIWRLYPKNERARNSLIVKGVVLQGVAISVLDRNPYLLSGGSDKPTVKITIGNCPHSIANNEIEKGLKTLNGLELCSKIFDQCYRRENGELTSWKSGRRYAYIVKPDSPLPTEFKVGNWMASLYYYGQPREERVFDRFRRTNNRVSGNDQQNTMQSDEVASENGGERKEMEECGEKDEVDKRSENSVRQEQENGEKDSGSSETVNENIANVHSQTDTSDENTASEERGRSDPRRRDSRDRIRSKSLSPAAFARSPRRISPTPTPHRKSKRHVSNDSLPTPSGKVAKNSDELDYEKVDPFDGSPRVPLTSDDSGWE